MSSGLIPNHQTSRITTFRIRTINRRPSLTTLTHTIGSLSNDDGDGDGYENVIYIKSEFALLQTLSRLFHLVQFVKFWQISLELNSKELYQTSGKEKENCCFVFPSSTKREIRHFHVEVVQRRLRNVQKSVIHVQGCCFANPTLLVFCRSHYLCRRRYVSSLTYKFCGTLKNQHTIRREQQTQSPVWWSISNSHSQKGHHH